MKIRKNTLIFLVFTCAFVTEKCFGSTHDLEQGNPSRTANQALSPTIYPLQPDDTDSFEANTTRWGTRARTRFAFCDSFPSVLFTGGNLLFAASMATASSSMKLFFDGNSSSSCCKNDEVISMLNITSACLLSAGFVAHCAGFCIKRSRRS